jgi:transposase
MSRPVRGCSLKLVGEASEWDGRRVRTDMEQWAEIRRRVLVEGLSKREACREYRVGWRTLAKMLALPEPPGYRRRGPRPKPVLGPFAGVIEQILAGDADPLTPRKQRHTAKRIFERLRDEHGYAGSEVTVRRFVAEHHRTRGEVFVPLSQPPGQAQFDFGVRGDDVAVFGCVLRLGLST